MATLCADQESSNDRMVEAVTQQYIDAMSIGDSAAAVALMHDDIAVESYLDQFHVAPGKRLNGADNVFQMLTHRDARWPTLSFKGMIVGVAQQTAKVHVAYRIRHAATKLEHSGVMDQFVTVQDEKIVRVALVYDGAALASFQAAVWHRILERHLE